MQEDLVVKMADFGFTINQAKVYLSIVQSGKTRVGSISKNTQLHRQDIYKLLPKLERMGLITKTIDKPFMIEALKVNKALEGIIAKEREKAYKKISHLERNLKEMVQAIQQQPDIKEEAQFTLLSTNEAMKNKSDITFKKKRKNFMIVSTTKSIMSSEGNYYRNFFQMIVNSKAKARLIIVGSEGQEELDQIIEKIAPKSGCFKVKSIHRCPCKDYQVVDNKEVWITTQQLTQAGYPSILWTNDANIVGAYYENFIETWNSPQATTVYENKISKEHAKNNRGPTPHQISP